MRLYLSKKETSAVVNALQNARLDKSPLSEECLTVLNRIADCMYYQKSGRQSKGKKSKKG